MDITEKITSYEDACKELNLNPENLPVVDMLPEKDRKSIVAYYKLVIIIRALNEGWEPDFSNHNALKYLNYIWVDSTGIAYTYTTYTASYTDAYGGSRLCFKNRELAEYARETFNNLYVCFLYVDFSKIENQLITNL